MCSRRPGLREGWGAPARFTRLGALEEVQRLLLELDPSLAGDNPALLPWQQAEYRALGWMLDNDYEDAALTPPGQDGGIDITSSDAVAQVKAHAKPVGLKDVQRLYGIAAALERRPVFFSTAGYTRAAQQGADEHGVDLLVIHGTEVEQVSIGW